MSRPGTSRDVSFRAVATFMSTPDTDDNNDDDIEESFDGAEAEMEEEELDGLLEDLPAGSVTRKPSDSARRRVEEYMEMKRAAKELADLDSFDFE
jgi:hypothetical protein